MRYKDVIAPGFPAGRPNGANRCHMIWDVQCEMGIRRPTVPWKRTAGGHLLLEHDYLQPGPAQLQRRRDPHDPAAHDGDTAANTTTTASLKNPTSSHSDPRPHPHSWTPRPAPAPNLAQRGYVGEWMNQITRGGSDLVRTLEMSPSTPPRQNELQAITGIEYGCEVRGCVGA
jgi:hypothetical protein